MYRDKRVLGIIPARGGSKGLPGKNIRVLLDKPLIAWTIRQALASSYLDRVIVTTDDKDIAEISKKYGADVPFLRPEELATDEARTIDVVLQAISRLELDNRFYDLVMLLQPTSPLREAGDIAGAIELLFLKNAQSVVSVCEAEHHPFWTNTLPSDGCMSAFIRPEIKHKHRQQLPLFYRLNGAVYLANIAYLKEHRDFIGAETYAYIMPAERSIDIDSELDFKFAEFLMGGG